MKFHVLLTSYELVSIDSAILQSLNWVVLVVLGMASDDEGLWSQTAEEAFQDAVAMYPPCGHQKIISEDGKMCGKSK